jgi:hypothetical protein
MRDAFNNRMHYTKRAHEQQIQNIEHVTLGVAGSDDSPSPASAPGVLGVSSPVLDCAACKRQLDENRQKR